MSHHHSHSHGHHGHSHGGHEPGRKANFATKANAVTGFAIDFSTNLALFASLIDYCFKKDDSDQLGYSVRGLFLGMLLALFVAFSTTYCHFFQKKQTQAEDSEPAGPKEGEVKGEEEAMPPSGSQESVSVISDDVVIEVKPSLEDVRRTSAQRNAPRTVVQPPLPWYEKIFLVGDVVGHVGDIVGPLNLLVRILGADSLIFGGQLGLTGALILLGVAGSVADIRACSVVLKAERQQAPQSQEVGEEKADFWTNFSAFMEWPVEATSTTVLIAALVDYLLASRKVDALGYSVEGVAIGSLFGAATASANVYCHWLKNTQLQARQSLMNDGGKDMDSTSLPVWKKLAWGLDGAGHVGDVATPLLLIAQITGLAKTHLALQVAVSGAVLAWGVVGSMADFQTCGRALKKDERDRQKAALAVGSDFELEKRLIEWVDGENTTV